jgi:hypothetical protein
VKGDKMNEMTTEITYLPYCGEANTETVLRLAKQRAVDRGIAQVVVASETGRSALKALDIMQGSASLVVVTHYPATTWGPEGKIPIGLQRPEYASVRQQLLAGGAQIVQGTVPFAPPSRSLDWDYPTPEAMVDKTLELWGAGSKIAIEVAVMATDAGAVENGQEVISCAGTYKGLDTALVVRATYSMNFFREFEVREIIVKPRCRVRQLPEHESENWRGDLSGYYRPAAEGDENRS